MIRSIPGKTATGPIDVAHTRPRAAIAFDFGAIAALAVVAQAVYFSAAQGRAIISADSVQYVAAAETLLNGDDIAHFEMRKPGYILWLWLIGTIAGNIGWAAIVANHALLATLPLGAYGFGLLLHSRVLGWLAALVTIAKLETAVWGNRMMAEPLYTILLTFGLLAACCALKKTDWQRRGLKNRGGFEGGIESPLPNMRCTEWLLAGTLLGLAWLTRGTAAAVIAAIAAMLVFGALVSAFTNFRFVAGGGRNLVALMVPVVVVALLECSLNSLTTGRFALSTGTKGAALLLRMTYHQGELLPDSPEGRRVLAWLPERGKSDALVCDDLDIWMARYRALRDGGLSEWEYDRLMGALAVQLMRRDTTNFVLSASAMGWRHLLRRGDGRVLSGVFDHQSRAAFVDAKGPDAFWWAMPEMSDSRREALVARMQAAAATKAPFGDAAIWSAARYWFTLTPPREVIQVLRGLGGAIVVAGLFAGLALGPDRRPFAFLATVFIAEAALVGGLAITTDRFQFVWIAVDAALAGGAVVIPAMLAVKAIRTAWLRRQSASAVWSAAT